MFSRNKNAKVTVIIVALMSMILVSGFAEYDKDHVVKVMRDNVSLMGEIGAAAGAEDWVMAAQKLYAIADGMVGVMNYDPPRGSKADWTATMGEFVFAAYRGIGACGAKDSEALQESIAELRTLNRQGHGTHK
jgi:hypothetical protein